MKKKITLIALSSFLTLVLSIIAFLPVNFNTVDVQAWMSEVNDDTALLNMSIPGTHDSGALYSIADVSGKCQDLSIKEQLKVGARFLDIRLQSVNDKLKVVHSFVDQKLSFKKVLDDVSAFIDKYPSEFVIISIKEDANSKNSTKSFQDLVTNELASYNRVDYSTKLPQTLKDARGKIFIFSRFNAPYGIQAYNGWQDSTTFEIDGIHVQDNYAIDHIQTKKESILSAIEHCQTNPELLHINFVSCYLNDSFPPTYAGTTAKELNEWIQDYLYSSQNKKTVGIVLFDFITEKLAYSVYRNNIE